MVKNVFVMSCLAALVMTLPAQARCTDCGSQVRVIDLSIAQSDKPERFKGPVNLLIKKINRLRYGAITDNKTNFTAGPDLGSAKFVFIPTSEATKAQAEAANAGLASDRSILASRMATLMQEVSPVGTPKKKPEPDLDEIRVKLSQCSDRIADTYKEITLLERKIQEGHENIVRLARNSDDTLSREGGEVELISSMSAEREDINLRLSKSEWPIEEVGKDRDCLRSIQSTMEGISLDPTFSDWFSKASNWKAFTAVQSSVADLLKKVDEVDVDSKRFKDFSAAKSGLADWRDLLTGLQRKDQFEQKVPLRCGHPFLETKTVEYQITLHDRLETDETKATKVVKVATVECPTVVTVTGGMGISGIDQHDFKLVPSVKKVEDNPNTPQDETGTTTVNVIGFDNRGSQQVNPVVLINTRLTDCQSFNLHASAGTVFDLNNTSSSVAIGYLLGLSVSLRDSLFLTAGVQFGRDYKLADGHFVGEEVPSGITQPPVERKWTTSWGVAATFKIR